LRGGALVAATAADQRISIVAPGDAQPRVRLEGPRAHLDVLVSDGARRLWAAVSDGSVWHFDVSRMEIDPAPKQSRKGKPTFRLTNHPTPHVLELEVVAPGRAVSADLDGGLCSWVRGQDDARAYRRPKSDPTGSSKYAISHIAVAGKCIVDREGATGFLVLDAASLELVAKLPHKAANGALTAGTTLVSTGGEEARPVLSDRNLGKDSSSRWTRGWNQRRRVGRCHSRVFLSRRTGRRGRRGDHGRRRSEDAYESKLRTDVVPRRDVSAWGASIVSPPTMSSDSMRAFPQGRTPPWLGPRGWERGSKRPTPRRRRSEPPDELRFHDTTSTLWRGRTATPSRSRTRSGATVLPRTRFRTRSTAASCRRV